MSDSKNTLAATLEEEAVTKKEKELRSSVMVGSVLSGILAAFSTSVFLVLILLTVGMSLHEDIPLLMTVLALLMAFSVFMCVLVTNQHQEDVAELQAFLLKKS